MESTLTGEKEAVYLMVSEDKDYKIVIDNGEYKVDVGDKLISLYDYN